MDKLYSRIKDTNTFNICLNDWQILVIRKLLDKIPEKIDDILQLSGIFQQCINDYSPTNEELLKLKYYRQLQEKQDRGEELNDKEIDDLKIGKTINITDKVFLGKEETYDYILKNVKLNKT